MGWLKKMHKKDLHPFRQLNLVQISSDEIYSDNCGNSITNIYNNFRGNGKQT